MMKQIWAFLYRLASPQSFYGLATRFFPVLFGLSVVFFFGGLALGLFVAPADYQQGEAFRIIYLHVPAAFLSLAIYSVMAFNAVLLLIWGIKLSDIVIRVSAPFGACVTLIALVTGALWGQPMWGTWWIWDARLTSELILFFLYLGILLMRASLERQSIAPKAVAVLVLVGFVDIPLIHYSVYWWNTLHQGATIATLKPHIASSMLYPLLMTLFGLFLYYAGFVFYRARSELLWQERRAHWVKDLLAKELSL